MHRLTYNSDIVRQAPDQLAVFSRQVENRAGGARLPGSLAAACKDPLPAGFFRAGRGDFDIVVAMYHDQGHGPVKVLGIEASASSHK